MLHDIGIFLTHALRSAVMETSRTSVTAVSEESYLKKKAFQDTQLYVKHMSASDLQSPDIERKTISAARKGHDANLYRGKNYMLCRQVFFWKDNEPLKKNRLQKQENS